MQDPTFWSGEGQLRRAAVLHLSTAVVIAAAVALGPVLATDPPSGMRAVLAATTAAAMTAVVVIAVVALARPWLTRRAGATPLGRWSVAVAVLASVGLLGTVVLLLLPDGPAGTPLVDLRPPPGCVRNPEGAGCLTDRSLPGFDWIISWFGTGQLLLLLAIGTVSRSGRRALLAPAVAVVLLVLGVLWIVGWLPGIPAAPAALDIWMVGLGAVTLAGGGLLLPRVRSPRPHDDPAWAGRGPAVLAGYGWVLCVSNSAGLFYWVADRLNNDATPSGRSPITPPVPVLWAGLAFSIALFLLLVVALRSAVLFSRLRRQEYAALTAGRHSLSAHQLRRCRDVSTYHAMHRLVGEHALRLAGWYAAAATVLVTLGCAAVLSPARPHPSPTHGEAAVLKAVADIGDSLLSWLPVLVATIGLLVYRNEGVRRSVGVLWDVGTFWPRAAHPLAPPSYAERAVPELQTRTAGLLALAERDPRSLDGIILSGHSQGAVICAAVLLQLPARWRRRIWFFSYGCQLTRLYGRVFPAYFGPDRLPVLAEALHRPSGSPGWSNFWRHTDPLGWPVHAGERDVPVRDPEALHPSDGEIADPPIRNHSGYPDAPEYQRERSRVAPLLRRAVPAPRGGSD
ncbi:hypothetical protein [Micromonospora endolithica]|uniref:hypothetical protein n=1 Tax=Micromonospora endolithica TaxID=230091 RepID=UPI001EE0A455|nr:hypothetical protein [Micromonospora endolithica]